MSRLLDVVSTVKESSPAESVLSCPDLVMVEPATLDDFQDAMTTSQYAQVKLVVLESIFFSHKVWLMVELGQIVLSCVTLLSVGCNSCIEMFPGLLAFEVILYC